MELSVAPLDVAVCGGGPGGLIAAITLSEAGHAVAVFEQTPIFRRVGADVNLTPNAVHAVDGLGVGDRLREMSARPAFRISRIWDTGEETSRLPMSSAAEQRYGAPQLTIHRADLLRALQDKLPPESLRLDHKVAALHVDEEGIAVVFANGAAHRADVVVGADGIHSAIRHELFGPDDPRYTGLVSFRATVPRDQIDVPGLDSFTKWWGPTTDIQLVVFPLNGDEVFVFATARDDAWREESWTSAGDVGELRRLYADFHPDAVAVLVACTAVTKSALHVRDPMPTWSAGSATLLGDAAHPMVPFMAQGACMAIEDAVVLSRCLADATTADVPAALSRYERARLGRTARVQRQSLSNDWMKRQDDADWLYGYNAWTVDLDQSS